MTILEISQIIFNLVTSLAVIVIAILISLVAYDVIKFSRSVKKFNKFLENIFSLSFISKFFKKKKK